MDKMCDISLCFIDKDEPHWAISKVSAMILTCADISLCWQNLRKTHYLVKLIWGPFEKQCKMLARILLPWNVRHIQFTFIPTLNFLITLRLDNIIAKILCDEFIWEIWLISETWLDCSKLTYNTCNSTNKGSKNWSITFKGHKVVLLKAILAKTSNFWPIGPIELKFWHLVLKMIHFNISLRRSHGSSFRPLWWLLLGP